MAQCSPPPKYATDYSRPTLYFDTATKTKHWFSVIYITDISLSQFFNAWLYFTKRNAQIVSRTEAIASLGLYTF